MGRASLFLGEHLNASQSRSLQDQPVEGRGRVFCRILGLEQGAHRRQGQAPPVGGNLNLPHPRARSSAKRRHAQIGQEQVGARAHGGDMGQTRDGRRGQGANTMRAKVITLRFSPQIIRFDDAALVALQQKVVLEHVRDHIV